MPTILRHSFFCREWAFSEARIQLSAWIEPRSPFCGRVRASEAYLSLLHVVMAHRYSARCMAAGPRDAGLIGRSYYRAR